jgi:subtilisin family serine protease
MARKYAILRGTRRSTTRGLESATGAGPAAPAVDLDKARVDVADLSSREAGRLARDADVAVLAPVMPTTLIRPLEAPAPVAAAGPAWGITAVGADVSQFDGTDVIVSILDTGIDGQHAAFQGVTLTEQDFSGSGNGDRQGHGTHCAGTVFGRDVSGTRIGVARGVQKALIGKVLGDDGSGSSDALFQAMNWALQGGARVISMSLGFDFPGLVDDLHTNQDVPIAAATSIALEAYRGNLHMFDALMGMVRASLGFGAGTVVVAASGNESQRPTYEVAASLPSAAEGVVSVAALGRKGTKLEVTFFSNTLAQISAPGLDILSAKAGGGLTTMSGTSMACPHVAGVTALWWESVMASPVPANAQVVTNKLLATARTTGFVAGVDIADRGVGIVAAP